LETCHCERSEAIQRKRESVDCFVASLLAMTSERSPAHRSHCEPTGPAFADPMKDSAIVIAVVHLAPLAGRGREHLASG